MRSIALALLVTAAIGCGGGEEELTCELLADDDNCWASAAEAASACLTDGLRGVLRADRAECSFADGTRVVFDAPLPNDAAGLEQLGFRVVRSDGTECARFLDTFANRMELTAGGATVVSELHAGGDFHLHCPDTTYSTTFDTLFTCAPGVGPTDGFELDGSHVQFAIISAATPAALFRCELLITSP